MLLALDIGNTNMVLGLYSRDKLLHHWRLETHKERTSDEWGLLIKDLLRSNGRELSVITGIAVSNVVPPVERAIVSMCERYFRRAPLLVTHNLKLNIKIRVNTPSEVGADRIVNAVSAHHRFKKPLIVVDFGTATTFDYVTARGEYLGGPITPGLGISAEALFQKTSRLPRIDISKPSSVLGRNTVECIQSGLYYGYTGMVDAMITRIENEMGKKTYVIATGGLSALIAEESKKISKTDEFLTLEGLRLIYEWNRR